MEDYFSLLEPCLQTLIQSTKGFGFTSSALGNAAQAEFTKCSHCQCTYNCMSSINLKRQRLSWAKTELRQRVMWVQQQNISGVKKRTMLRKTILASDPDCVRIFEGNTRSKETNTCKLLYGIWMEQNIGSHALISDHLCATDHAGVSLSTERLSECSQINTAVVQSPFMRA